MLRVPTPSLRYSEQDKRTEEMARAAAGRQQQISRCAASRCARHVACEEPFEACEEPFVPREEPSTAREEPHASEESEHRTTSAQLQRLAVDHRLADALTLFQSTQRVCVTEGDGVCIAESSYGSFCPPRLSCSVCMWLLAREETHVALGPRRDTTASRLALVLEACGVHGSAVT